MIETLSTLGDVSTIWFVCLTFALCLIPLALVGGMVYGLVKLLGAVPPILEQGRKGMAQVVDGADKASKRVAAPFIAASAFSSQVKGMVRSLGQLTGGKHDLEK